MKFLDKFDTSGRVDLLKEKLKLFIVENSQWKIRKKNIPIKGIFKDGRDKFYS